MKQTLMILGIAGLCAFAVNADEYKLMGLAPFGEPKFVGLIYDELVDLKDDGSLRLNLTPVRVPRCRDRFLARSMMQRSSPPTVSSGRTTIG